METRKATPEELKAIALVMEHGVGSVTINFDGSPQVKSEKGMDFLDEKMLRNMNEPELRGYIAKLHEKIRELETEIQDRDDCNLNQDGESHERR